MVQTAGAEHVPAARCATHPCLGTVFEFCESDYRGLILGNVTSSLIKKPKRTAQHLLVSLPRPRVHPMWPHKQKPLQKPAAQTRLPCVRTTKSNKLNGIVALRITRVIDRCSSYFCAPGQRCRCPLIATCRLHMHLLHLDMRPSFSSICHARALFRLHSVSRSNRALFFFKLVRPVDQSQFWRPVARGRGQGAAPSAGVLVPDVRQRNAVAHRAQANPGRICSESRWLKPW